MFDIEKSYWNGCGKYEDIQEMIQEGKIILNKNDKKLHSKNARQYYRFYNDGDCHYTLTKKAENNNMTVNEFLENENDKMFLNFKEKYLK